MVPSAIIDHGVIHDLLNPLTSIVGNLHLLDEMLGDTASPQVRKCVDAGAGSAEELRDMLENLRYLMGPAGVLPAPVARVDLAAVIEKLVKSARHSDKPPPELRILTAQQPLVRGNERLLRRLGNVLLRTVTRLGSRASVSVDVIDHSTVDVRFVHYGRAIPPELIGALFDPNFSQIQQDRGLKIDRARGLWFARAAAEAHGGSIAYEPMTDGGSFIVQLPKE